MCPHDVSGGHCSKHASSFADFNLWDRALTRWEMVRWTSCSEVGVGGNVVDWRTAKWDLVGGFADTQKTQKKTFCRFPDKHHRRRGGELQGGDMSLQPKAGTHIRAHQV